MKSYVYIYRSSMFIKASFFLIIGLSYFPLPCDDRFCFIPFVVILSFFRFDDNRYLLFVRALSNQVISFGLIPIPA